MEMGVWARTVAARRRNRRRWVVFIASGLFLLCFFEGLFGPVIIFDKFRKERQASGIYLPSVSSAPAEAIMPISGS